MEIYGAAAVMGFGPHEVDAWEPWQFRAAWDGWKAAKVAPKTRAPTAAEFEAAVAKTMH